MRLWIARLSLIALFGCAAGASVSPAAGDDRLGAHLDAQGKTLHVRVASVNATRMEVWLYAAPAREPEKERRVLERTAGGVWAADIDVSELDLRAPIYYGLRAWGPNWPYDPAWKPGSSAGFVCDVDRNGNRFNPNKLLLDPYAREMSHDPVTPKQMDYTLYGTGPQHRLKDSGLVAPKGIVWADAGNEFGQKPERPFKDEVIYEVHLRGLTMNDPSVPEKLRGTYAGAALKASYLKELGVTAIELLPIHEYQNDINDVKASTEGDNYWGYMTLNYFSPDRRYAADKSPGGPTKEFREMVKAFHEQGLKVYLDVVYNHTGEGGVWDKTGEVAALLSFRGLDSATYYELADDPKFYTDNTICGANVNCVDEIVRTLIVDSLKYWADEMGVDGLRFDIAVILGNAVRRGGLRFQNDPRNALGRAMRELRGVDLIAEPWAGGEGGFQLGNFPSGYAEWNGDYRKEIRLAQNKLGVEKLTPGQIATRVAGSSDLFGDDGRKPWHSVNYLSCHDGFTLRDAYSYTKKQNDQPWPYGPSDGGDDHNWSWDHGNDRVLQRQAARTGLAILMSSAGVPMFTGGDEFLRTQYGNNNPWNLDSEKNWLNWEDAKKYTGFLRYAKRLIAFRHAHPALRPADWFRGADRNTNGMKDITWLRATGMEADQAYLNDPDKHFLGWRIDGTEFEDPAASILVAYNRSAEPARVTMPAALEGRAWHRICDSAREDAGEEPLKRPDYELAARSVGIFVEK
ncbi:MAG: glycogen-debranching protein [Planctomycetes bacterium]|nr:glycogen-debranching protein [Planctomycetota bacterium]